MTKFAVQCRDYTSSGRKTREAAEKLKESIEALAICEYEHTVVEVSDER